MLATHPESRQDGSAIPEGVELNLLSNDGRVGQLGPARRRIRVPQNGRQLQVADVGAEVRSERENESHGFDSFMIN